MFVLRMTNGHNGHSTNNSNFTFKKYLSQAQMGMSTSMSSLSSYASQASSATLTSNATLTTHGSGSGGSLNKSTYTCLWHDKHTGKLLAAKCDKHRALVEVYNSETCSYEYSIETDESRERPLRRIAAMCCTSDGRLVCVDLVQNLVKMFRFV